MPHEPDLRASDADREATVERLRGAALEGRIDSDELEQRVADAYAARWCSELVRLTDDVTLPPAPYVYVRPQRRVNGLAIASIVAAVFWFGWLGSVAGIVLGYIALGQISRSGGAQTGRAAAIVGIALGFFGLTALLMLILLSGIGD